ANTLMSNIRLETSNIGFGWILVFANTGVVIQDVDTLEPCISTVDDSSSHIARCNIASRYECSTRIVVLKTRSGQRCQGEMDSLRFEQTCTPPTDALRSARNEYDLLPQSMRT